MYRSSMTFRADRVLRFFGAIAIVAVVAFGAAVISCTPARAALSNTKSALSRAERFCADAGHGYRITTSTLVYRSETAHEPIYIDADCTAPGRRSVRLIAGVHSNYVWNDRDGTLYYVR